MPSGWILPSYPLARAENLKLGSVLDFAKGMVSGCATNRRRILLCALPHAWQFREKPTLSARPEPSMAS
jgi:hypothetical protein